MRAIGYCPGTPGSWLLLPLLAFAVAAPAYAQDSLALRVGEVVRVQYVGHAQPSYEGRLLAIDRDSFVLAPAGSAASFPIPRSDIARIWVNEGRAARTWAGVGIGLLAGGVAGAAIGALSYQRATCQDCLDLGRGVTAAVGAVLGAGAGGLVGAIAGSETKRDRWRALDLAPAVTVTPARASRLGLAARVRLGGGPVRASSGT